MKRSTRRGIFKWAAAAVAAALGAAFEGTALARQGSDKKPQTRDTGTAPERGPRELFAVVDAAGNLVQPGGMGLPLGAGFSRLGPSSPSYTLSGRPVNVHLNGLARVRLK